MSAKKTPKKSAPKKQKTKTDIDDILGAPKKAKRSAKKTKPPEDISDILGSVGRQMAETGFTFNQLQPPKTEKSVRKGGIWERRMEKGKNLGRTCLVCNDPLKASGGRPRVICTKKECFRRYRNMYRLDYDATQKATQA